MAVPKDKDNMNETTNLFNTGQYMFFYFTYLND